MMDAGVGNPETGKILVVDDGPENLRYLLEMLSENRYSVRPAVNAHIALNFLKSEIPDLILLDIRMPDIDGYTLCRMIKAQQDLADIPIIFLSAEHDIEEKAKAYACGAIDYITKPFEEEEVLLRIRTHLTLRNLQRQLEARVQARTAELTALNHRLEEIVQERTRDLEAALTELSETNSRLLDMSMCDGLTGLKNRRFFDECIQREWERARRARSPVSLLLVDIDHFKAVNDTWGHTGGDACLKALAQTMQDSLRRASDEAARYGGEEFAVVLPNTALAGALQMAEKLRSRIENMRIVHDEVEIHITASIGVASRTPEFEEPVGALIVDADRALYRAKDRGRNRVESAEACEEAIPSRAR
jgi:diguanylate cyclase (GGDEF)-like protein